MKFDIDQVAEMAKLRIPKEGRAAWAAEIEDLLEMLAGLPRPDGTEEVQMPEAAALLYGNLREDVAEPSLPQAEVLLNAPKVAGGYFALPKTVE